MNTQYRNHVVLFATAVLAMVALVTSACSFHTGTLGETTQVIDITLDEAMLNQSAPTFTIHGHDFWEDLLDNVTRVEFNDGYLRFFGTRAQPDGSRVNGSIDLSLGAEEGLLLARIIAVDIPGLELNDPIVVKVNRELKSDLSHMDFDRSHMDFDRTADVYFEEVVVSEDALQMKILVTVRF